MRRLCRSPYRHSTALVRSRNSRQEIRGSRISYFTALTSATYVVLPKENHMQLAEAATLDRKSGEAEGSAVPRTSPANAEYYSQTELSSRPERRGAERSAVFFSFKPS